MRQIGNYTVDDVPVGEGGMGRVLRGWAPNGLLVAIKEILPEFVVDSEFRYRIQQEIKFLVKLRGKPGIVNVYDSFELNNHLYIVMEFVEGQSIEQYVNASGPVPVKAAVKFMVRILEAMQYVHGELLVHRDIKPGNIMIRPDNSICILDFGVAKNSDQSSGGGHTVMGTVIGTDGYMSPEQANGMSIDHRSDIYSLGCVFFYMLTGKHAYTSDGNDVKMMMDIVNKPFPRLKDFISNVPSEVNEAMEKATNKNMMLRYQSCREFGMDLTAYLKRVDGGTKIDPPTSPENLSVSVGREMCDICAGVDNQKVSRHHADVKYKLRDGKPYYVYTDCSSNGTTIDGNKLSRGMSFNVPEGVTPTIWLANDPSAALDWSQVVELMKSKLASVQDAESDKITDERSEDPGDGDDNGKHQSFIDKIKTFFGRLSI